MISAHDIPETLGTVQIVPVPREDKAPRVRGWPDTWLSPEQVQHHLADGNNIAMRVGSASGNIVDSDLDCSESLILADLYLPPTRAEFGRRSKPRSHRLYRAPGATYASFADPLASTTLIELRADGRTGGAHITLIPPSITSGERREWHGDTIEPVDIDAAVLARRMAWLAIGCLTMRYISKYAAERPSSDLPALLWEADPALGRKAYHWLGQPAPDEPRRHPKPRSAISHEELRLAEIVAEIPNSGLDWTEWNRIGLAIFAASGGGEEGFIAFDDLSARCPSKYNPHTARERWDNYRRSPPNRIGVGTLVHLARENGWQRK